LLLIVAGIVVIDRFIPETGDQPSTRIVKLESDSRVTTAPVKPAPTSELGNIFLSQDKRQSVAVLPFVNVSDDKANEYFSDGISEELLNLLVRIQSLRVPSRTSSFTFKGSAKKLSEIGRELGVEYILEGSIRKSGDRVRVTAKLIKVDTDTHLWSATYTRKLDDIFAVQDEIAQAIVEALQLTLNVADRERLAARSTNNADAYNEYLIGRYLWNKRTPTSLLTAVEHMREAVAMDPEFDQAWAALANVYVMIPEYASGTSAGTARAGAIEIYIPLAREAVAKALAINPNSARALTTSGYYKGHYDFDWEGAKSDYKRAVILEPGYAIAHQWYGEMLNLRGHLDEALSQLQLARESDPLSVVVRHVPGYFLLWAMRLDEAEVHYMDALEIDPPFRWTIHNLDMLNTLRGDYAEARRRVRQLAEMEGFDPAADLARIDALENPALKELALTLLQQRQDLGDGVFGKALQFAVLGEFELALENLEVGFAAGDPLATAMNYVKLYDPLRGNPRFQVMLKKMNLLPPL